jgi:hypothetical protein
LAQAVGSSAPEILLAVLETVKGLGPAEKQNPGRAAPKYRRFLEAT